MTRDTTDAGRLVRASVFVGLGTLLSRVTGLVRVVALAYAIGRGSLADSYNLANTTPNVIYELILGGVLTATLVPLFVEHLERRDERATSAVVTAAAILLVVLTVVAVVAAPLIARVYSLDTSGAERDAQVEVMTFLIRCFMPQICFYGLTAMATALLNARRRFAAAAYAPVLNNIAVVATLLAFVRLADGSQEGWRDVTRIRGETDLLLLLGLGTTAGVAALALSLLPALARAGVRLRPVLDLKHAAVRRVVALSGWTVGYVVANQVALLFVLLLANSGDDGAVSAYQYAFVFFQLPHGLFAVSVMTTMTPELARDAAAGDMPALRRDFSMGLRFVVLVVLPAAVALGVLAQPAVATLTLGGSAFGATDAAVTADVLQTLAIGLVPFSVYLYTLRGFYALQDTRTPFVVNAFENACNIALAIALFALLDVQGLGLAYSGAYGIAAVVALLMLQRRTGTVVDARVTATLVRAGLAAGALAMVAAPIAGAIGQGSPVRAAVAAGAGALAGGAVYVAVLAATGADEVGMLARLVRKRGKASPGV